MDLQLNSKVALISGGSKGIGKATARALAREGVDVAIAARDMTVAEQVAAEIARETNRKVQAFKVDTGDDAAVKRMVGEVAAQFGRIDILVNCAAAPGGQSKPPSMSEITNDEFWAEMNVKVLGYLRTARECAPHMTKQGWGRIINVSGLAARSTGTILGSVRNVSVASLTKNMAEELSGKGINVTCVHPGLTRTEKTAEVVARMAAAANITPEEQEKRMASRNLTRTLIGADNIADVITFLASPRSVAVNGDAVAAGGGAPGTIHY